MDMAPSWMLPLTWITLAAFIVAAIVAGLFMWRTRDVKHWGPLRYVGLLYGLSGILMGFHWSLLLMTEMGENPVIDSLFAVTAISGSIAFAAGTYWLLRVVRLLAAD